MRISARNVLRGKVQKVETGAVNALVTLELAPGVEVVAMITRQSAEALELRPGGTAYAVIKASSVMVGVE